ncbi:MAG: hypothetical protein ACI9Q9_000241 [Flavobacterium sp.]|jgi:hypothetical protein
MKYKKWSLEEKRFSIEKMWKVLLIGQRSHDQ